MSVAWPSILHHNIGDWFIAPMNALGPITPAGQQVIGLDAGLWQVSLSGFTIWTADQVREWRGVVASLQGGLEALIIGPFDCRQAPRAPGANPFVGITHSDGALFSDNAGYQQSAAVVAVKQAAARRATSLTVEIISAGDDLRRGMYFSIADRLYIITSPPSKHHGNQATFNFLPPLRMAAPIGTDVEFARPKATMRLATPGAGRLALRNGRFGEPSLDLVESFHGLG